MRVVDDQRLFYLKVGRHDGPKLVSSGWYTPSILRFTAPNGEFSVKDGSRREVTRRPYLWLYPTANYDVSLDGRLLLFTSPGLRPTPVTELQVVLNFSEVLNGLVPIE